MDKAVIFIVEGATDKKSLENIFKKVYRNKNIHFEFTHGDITSDNDISINNVENEIYKYVEAFKKDKKLRTSDIWQIVQIFDMDGAYIDETDIMLGANSKFEYTTHAIYCNDLQRVKDRNKHKCELMNYLLKLSSIKGISYKCYFFSSNLDHALYNRFNLDDETKTKLANRFYEQFLGKEPLFIKFLDMEVVNGVPESHPASWKYIKEEKHSLERHTNLNIYFKDNPIL